MAMIVEINFIEPKQKRNRAPFFVLFSSFVLIAAIVFSYVWLHNYLSHQVESLQQQIQANEQTVTEIQAEEAKVNQRLTLQSQITQIEENTFPAIALMDYFIALLPEGGSFQSYNYAGETITISTHMDTYSDIAAYINVLHQQSFINSVDINGVQTIAVSETDHNYLATYVISIDDQAWMEEANAQ